MKKIVLEAAAKLNLSLDITGIREDGYHLLDSVMQSIGLYDKVILVKTESGVSLTVDNPNIPSDNKNTAYKAAEVFFAETGILGGVEISIEKNIPFFAGMGGGSADAAAVIVGLNELYETNLPVERLQELGLKVGADVPFCIVGGTLLAQGIGDVLSKVKPLRKCYILLAKPEFGVNTGNAYRQFDENGKCHTPDKFGMLCAIQSRNLADICAKMENVFEQFIEVPNRIYMKEIMRNNGAIGTCMSGSGPTVFGIFNSKEQAEKSASELSVYAKDICVCTPVSKGCKIVEITE